MPAFPVADPADPKTAIGPMVSQRQYEGVQSYIRKGIEEGAEVLVGGEGHPRGRSCMRTTLWTSTLNCSSLS
jgi:aldehyde dehydrogenase (NAD+)